MKKEDVVRKENGQRGGENDLSDNCQEGNGARKQQQKRDHDV